MRNNRRKQTSIKNNHTSTRLTTAFKQRLKKDIKSLFVNREFVELLEATLKKLTQKDKFECLQYFKKLSMQVMRTPDPDHYKAFQDQYDEYLSEIAEEQVFFEPVRWIDAELEEMYALADVQTVAKNLEQESLEQVAAFDLELVPEKKVIEMLGMSKSKLLRLRAEGMPYKHIGKPVFYNLNEVKTWLKNDAA